METNRKAELQRKVDELEQWLKDNPNHINTVEVQSDLRQAKDELNNPEYND